MAKWYLEEGIGEHRAICVVAGKVAGSRIHWPGEVLAGHAEDALLISRTAGSPRGTARLASGQEVLIDRLPKSTSEGAAIRLQIVRPAIGERGRMKYAQARPSDIAPRSPTLAQVLISEGAEVAIVRRFPISGWGDLLAEALSREIAFPGGSLIFSPTPAMVTVDIDGTLAPRELALAAIEPLADTLKRFDLGGSIGIDFPTLSVKSERRAVDEALAAALTDWPHERTSMNGFGFVQLVSRLSSISLLHRGSFSPTGLIVRHLLRQAEQVGEPGALLLTAHPAITTKIKPEWQADLARRTGREIRLKAEPMLALEGAFAQAVPL